MQATACRMQLPLSCPRCCVDDNFANRSITSWCNILATVRMCSIATERAKLFRHWNTRQMQERESVRRAIYSAKLRQNTRLSARLQQKVSAKNFRFSRDSAKYFADSRDSTKVSAKRIIQQGFSEIFCCQREFSIFYSWRVKQLAIKALNINYFVSATGRAAILINTTAVLGGLSPKMKRGNFETNGFQPFSGFTGPSIGCSKAQNVIRIPSHLSKLVPKIDFKNPRHNT